MIQLAASALLDYMHFAEEYRPTHALGVSHAVSYAGAPGISVTYWVGRLDDQGRFIHSEQAPLIALQIPNAQQHLATSDEVDAILANLFTAGRAPDPNDPRMSVPVPGKREGDWKVHDIDAIASWLHPKLRGEVL